MRELCIRRACESLTGYVSTSRPISLSELREDGDLLKKFAAASLVAVFAALLALPAVATYNATISGHVISIQTLTPGAGYSGAAVAFTLDSGPPTGCVSGGWKQFIISSASVTDPETRKNLVAAVMMAKATGSTVVVGYDSTLGGFCDQGSYGVYYVHVSN
jgi:hypothetical protein